MSFESLDGESDPYSAAVREFRHLMLSQQGEEVNKHESARKQLKRLFKQMDGNGDGTVTDQEMYDFMLSLKLPEHVADVLIQQVDINHDGKVTYSEMAEFLWPRVESQREMGLVIEVVREALIAATGKKIISRALKNDTDKDDERLLASFAEKTNAVLVRGKLIDVRQLKRALHNLMSTGLGELSDYEIDMLAHSMDANNDSVVSAREFKSWLFLQKGYFKTGSNLTSGEFGVNTEPYEGGEAAAEAPSCDSFGGDDDVDPNISNPDEAEMVSPVVSPAVAGQEEMLAAERKTADDIRAAAVRLATNIAATEAVHKASSKKKMEEEQLAANNKKKKEDEEKEIAAKKKKENDRTLAASAKKKAEAQRAEAERISAAALDVNAKANEANDVETGSVGAGTYARVHHTMKDTTPLLLQSAQLAEEGNTSSSSPLSCSCVSVAGTVVGFVLAYSIVHSIFR
jgi:hypothetical protein